MKSILIAFLLCGICNATQERPKLVRVTIQFIEVPHLLLTELLGGEQSGGAAIHGKVMELTKTGASKIVETCMVVCKAGQKAAVKSIREEIYPTEYAPPSLAGSFGAAPGPRTSPLYPTNPKLRSPTAFDTRNTGVTLEVEPTLCENDQIIDLRLKPEFVRRLRLETVMEHKDQWGDSSVRMPIFETWRANASLILQSGKFELVSVITPKPVVAAPAAPQKILLFVRADIIPAPVSH